MIKAIIFDVGGVLLDTRMLASMFTYKFKLKKGQRMIPYHLAKKEMLGTIPMSKVYSFISKRFGMPVSEVRRTYVHAFSSKKPMPGMTMLLAQLRKKGFILAIISNAAWPDVYVNRKQKVYKQFNPVILSCEVGLVKPDRRIFYHALRKLKLKPREVIFVDDFPRHVRTARRLGMNAILFKNAKQLKKDLRKYGVEV